MAEPLLSSWFSSGEAPKRELLHEWSLVILYGILPPRVLSPLQLMNFEDMRDGLDSNYRLSKLISKMYSALHAYGAGLILDRDGAEDICQQVFLKVHEMGEKILQIKNPRAYLYSMVRNAGMDWLKANTSGMELPLEEDKNATNEYNPEAECLSKELQTVIMEGMGLLSPEAREILVLRDLQGMKYKKIATLSGGTEVRVKWMLRDARQKLKKYVEANYGRD